MPKVVDKRRTGAAGSDAEAWVLVDESVLEDRVAAIAARARREMEHPSTTLHGFAREVLALAEAEEASRAAYRGERPDDSQLVLPLAEVVSFPIAQTADRSDIVVNVRMVT